MRGPPGRPESSGPHAALPLTTCRATIPVGLARITAGERFLFLADKYAARVGEIVRISVRIHTNSNIN